jgi:hypothetical protein
VPEPSRLHLPEGYGEFEPLTLENAPSWDDHEPKLESARNYWLTLNSEAAPVVAPVWGIWLDGAFVFSTDPKSRKALAIAWNPAAVVHLESGDNVVIVHGVAEAFGGDDALPFVAAYERKYGIAVDPESPDQAVFRVNPKFALTWLEQDFLVTAIRWEF